MAITTRETTATGVTNKGAPLTNAEVDTNFIELVQTKVDVSGAIIFAAKAGEALSKGDVVYVSGVSGDQPVVSKADANVSSKMPAYGLAETDANNNAAVNIVTFGTLYELDTSAFSVGDTVYVSQTAGAITATKPAGESSLIQNVGKVIRSHASAGSIKVGGAGRANDTPNLDDGNVFIGNGSNQAVARALTGDDVSGGTITSFASTGIDDNATSNAITIDASQNTAFSGDITLTGTVDGRDVATDGTKLDGIESGATADQTNAEIRAAVEAATDSNVFTDADHTKLNGIEASADVTDTDNVTAAGALMDSEVTNLAQVKAFDSSDYATAAQGTTADSALQNVVEDTTPQLGGNLDFNGNLATSFTSTGIDDNATSTAITINSTGNATFSGTITANGAVVDRGIYRPGAAATGIRLSNASAVFPSDGTGTQTTGVADFGGTSYKWKDAYFSGTVNASGMSVDGTVSGVSGSAYTYYQGERGRFGYDGSRTAIEISDYNSSGNTTSKPIVFDTHGVEELRIDDGLSTFSGSLLAEGVVKVGLGGGAIGTNTALGRTTLNANTTGIYNTAVGMQCMVSNTTGNSNTGVGLNALIANTTGHSNTAVGESALQTNTTAVSNTAFGAKALAFNTASNNTGVGYQALYSSTTGIRNVALGSQSLYANTTGNANVGICQGLYNCTTGRGNTAIGSLNHNGVYAPVYDVTTENRRIVMGHTSITNAYVKVSWTVTSDKRDKTGFSPVPHGLDFITKLSPTEYQFKEGGREGTGGDGIRRYGFLAQDILALEGDDPVIIDAEDEDNLKLKESDLIPVLVNAIKEQQVIIESLTARLGALEL